MFVTYNGNEACLLHNYYNVNEACWLHILLMKHVGYIIDNATIITNYKTQ